MQKIDSGILYETAYLGVTVGAVLSSYGTIMIDAPLRPEDGRTWRTSLLSQRGGSHRLLVLLNAHLDRTLGARILEATVVSHHKTAFALRNRPTIFKGQSLESGADWELYDEAIGSRWALPDITFTQHLELNWGEANVLLEYHPGPSPDAIWVIIPDRQVIFVGDTVTPKQPPFLYQADIDAWTNSLDVLIKSYKNFTVIGGRSGEVTVESMREQRKLLNSLQKKLERLANRATLPDNFDPLISSVLGELEFPAKYTELYVRRLRNGLQHYFTRHYRPNALSEEIETEESET